MALSDQSQNPLLGKWETQHEIAPFNVIYDEHFQPALEIACSESLIEVEEIIKNSDEPTFKNTIEALLSTGRLLDRVVSTFYTITGAHTNKIRDELRLVFSSKLSDHNTNIYSNCELFDRINRVVETSHLNSLDTEQEGFKAYS